MTRYTVTINLDAAFEEGKHPRGKGGVFTSQSAAEGAKDPDKYVVKGERGTTHNEEPGREYHLRGRYNANEHHYVTLHSKTGQILAHATGRTQGYATVHGESSRTGIERGLTPAASHRRSDVHAAIQEHIKDTSKKN